MARLLFILIFVFSWNGTTHTMTNSDNRNFKVTIIDDFLRIEKSKTVMPDISKPRTHKYLSSQNNNPGNLRSCKTGKYQVYSSIEAGYDALLYDLRLKITGKSHWTDSTTTIHDFIDIYSTSSINDSSHTYVKIFCSETGLKSTDLLACQQAEIIARGIIRVENGELFRKLYRKKK